MNKLAAKPTTENIFISIIEDNQYENTNRFGTDLIKSKDIKSNNYLYCLNLESQLIDTVSKSDTFPFVFEKSYQCATLIKENKELAKMTYDLLFLQKETNRIEQQSYPGFKLNNPSNYEVSEKSKVLFEIADKIGLYHVELSGHPMTQIAPQVLEGELINSFIIRLRESVKKDSFKTKIKNQKIELNRHITQIKRYIDRIYTKNPKLIVASMVFYYQKDCANKITLNESAAHIEKFLSSLQKDMQQGFSGWWWKREYTTETSYRYNVTFFFNYEFIKIDSVSMRNQLNQAWFVVTQGQGLSLDRTTLSPQNTMFGANQNFIVYEIVRMIMRDLFLKLKPDRKFDHSGMGPLPKKLMPNEISPPPQLS